MSHLGLTTDRITTGLSAGFALLATTGGITGIIAPTRYAEGFGIKLTSASSPAVPFATATAARNFGNGLGILALLLTRQKRALGYIFLTGAVTAFLDAWICHIYGPKRDEGSKTIGHTVAGVIVAALGVVMVSSEEALL